MKQILTIACSTFGDRISNIRKLYDSIDIADKKIKLLVIHQVPSDLILSIESVSTIIELELQPNIEYIKDQSKGLTISRNIAIRKTQTRYMWVMDDDIQFIPDALQKVINNLESDNAICHTFESLKPLGSRRALYPKNGSKIEGKYILRVASFEMILDVNQLKQRNIFFREDMGVGGNAINLGEESVLIADILRSGGDVIHHSTPVNVHPEISTGTLVNSQNIFSKGVVIKRVFSGYQAIYFYLRDVNRIIRNRSGEFGEMPYRISLIKSLSKGLFY